MIVCVMAVAQPVLRQRKEEKARGATGTLWIGRWEVTAPPLGDEDPVKCDVKLWEGCARDWGDDKVRKGDVVLLESASRFEAIRPADVDYTQTSSLNPPMLKIRLNSYCPRTRYIHPSLLFSTAPYRAMDPPVATMNTVKSESTAIQARLD